MHVSEPKPKQMWSKSEKPEATYAGLAGIIIMGKPPLTGERE